MKKILFFGVLGMFALTTSCKREHRSETTGWKYNDAEWGGIEKQPQYEGQATGPNLVQIEGGTFVMGQTETDVMSDYRNVPRRMTVSSFYMDETEVSNSAYLEYLRWLKRVHRETPLVVRKATPDTLVWLEELAYNEPFVETYLRHPAHQEYPVVGVSWLQANEYCKWRTDRVNEAILVDAKVITLNVDQSGPENFNTKAYLAGQYTPEEGEKPYEDLVSGEQRSVKFEDGVLLPDYRLPTEAEWEFAALALIGNQAHPTEDRITDRRIYPWDGTTTRYPVHGVSQGKFVANFKRGRGDYMGMAGALNDNAHITAPVVSYVPNDYGLYNMAGNVNEWVKDVYRPTTSLTLRDVETQDLNAFRGNTFTTIERDAEGVPIEKDSMGRLKYRELSEEETADRLNFQHANVINYLDGDEQSESIYLKMEGDGKISNEGTMSLIDDNARVYKGGSWADRAFWLSPGARRFLNQERSSSVIGFRCAMGRVGSPSGNRIKGGNTIKSRKKRTRRRY